MPDEVDLSSLTSLPAPALAPAAEIRARGEQRSRRARAALAGAAALVVLATAGTAVALADRGKPDALQIGNAPTLTTAQEMITWAAFVPAQRMAELVGGEWVSESLGHDDEFPDQFDRCGVQLDQRLLTSAMRDVHTVDRARRVFLDVEDYASATDAAAVLHAREDGIRRCPTLTIDAPGAGSTETQTVVASSARSFTLRVVTHECQRDHADCKDTPSIRKTVASGHLLMSASSHRAAGEFTLDEIDRIADDFAARATQSYGKAETMPATPSAEAPVVARTYYGVFLWSGNEGQDSGRPEAQDSVRDRGNVLTTRLDCLDGGALAVNRDYPQASHGDVVVLLYDSAAQAEQFVNGYDGPVDGVGRITVTCLDSPHGLVPSPS
jgi:hypothetical protein